MLGGSYEKNIRIYNQEERFSIIIIKFSINLNQIKDISIVEYVRVIMMNIERYLNRVKLASYE